MTIPGVSRHARDRMQERHGRDLTRTEWRGAVLDIIDRRATLLSVAPNGEIWAVGIGCLTIRMVWRPEHGLIATVLADDTGNTKAGDAFKRGPIRERRA
jgi:hypothetical protein